MRKLILCAMLAPVVLSGCASDPSPLALAAPAKLAAPSKTCLATPQTANPIKPGDDIAVDDGKLRRAIGDDVSGWSACLSYIRRLHKGA